MRMKMAPAGVVGVVYLSAVGIDVMGLTMNADRHHDGSIGGDMDRLRASNTGFLGATPKAARARTRPRPMCGHLWLST